MKRNLFLFLCILFLFCVPTACDSFEPVEFVTDLEDRSAVTTETYRFSAQAAVDDLPVDLTVLVNGIVAEGESHSYTASLAEGENEITLRADRYGAKRSFVITYRKPNDTIEFESDIETFAVQNDVLTFFAEANYLDQPCSVRVRANGEFVESDSGIYDVPLRTGLNIVTFLGKSGDVEREKTFYFSYGTFLFVTDLTNGQAHEAEFSFAAGAVYTDGPCELTVLFGNKPVAPVQAGRYEVTLNPGRNTLLLVASCGNITMSRSYTVNL